MARAAPAACPLRDDAPKPKFAGCRERRSAISYVAVEVYGISAVGITRQVAHRSEAFGQSSHGQGRYAVGRVLEQVFQLADSHEALSLPLPVR